MRISKRGSGILLHITSLSSPLGIGDTGPAAYQFVDFLSKGGQSYWQILPVNPTEIGHGNSPYHAVSACACNPSLISPELLVQDGLLGPDALEEIPPFPENRVDYRAVQEYKVSLLEQAYQAFKGTHSPDDYEQFCHENAYWLDDFALFRVLKSRYEGKAWCDWPLELRDRRPEALGQARVSFQDSIESHRFLQYIALKQWLSLKDYCNGRGIEIIGDLPIYVVHDSADVWVRPEIFNLDQNKRPYRVAGVPPDYFSETGQRWGNPVYRWDVLKENGYDWWDQRIAHNLKLFDWVRIDHFRGFLAYWEIPASEKDAVNGKWVEGPGMDFFDHITQLFSPLPIIAEDLGTITPDVWELMDHFQLPGMKVLLFAFGPDIATNLYAPHNHVKDCVVYTGTHDNNTARGWFEKELNSEDRERIFRYLGRVIPPEEIHIELIRLAMMSVANTVIFPMQDLLGLGEASRTNLPATVKGNWEWRLAQNTLTSELAEKLRQMTEIYGRVQH